MAKTEQKKQARIDFVERGKSQKELCAKYKVTPQTMSNWVKAGGWKAMRTAYVSNSNAQANNIKELLNGLTEQRLELMNDLKEARRTKADADTINSLMASIARVDDGASKWNKTLENVDKENRISLATYLQVMTELFDALNVYSDKLYLQTLDFQEQFINRISTQYS